MSSSGAEAKPAIGSTSFKPLRSLSSRIDSNKGLPFSRTGTSQRVCKLLLERHGDRIVQLLVDDEDGRKLLKALLAVSFGASDQAGSNLLKRLLERDPVAVVPVICKKADNYAVARGLGACLVHGLSGVAASDLKPLSAAIAESVMEQLRTAEGEAAGLSDPVGEAPAVAAAQEAAAAAAAAAADADASGAKREDNEAAAEVRLSSDPKRRPSRVQELIEQQQRRLKEQQEPSKLRSAGSLSFESSSAGREKTGGCRPRGRFGSFEAIVREALLFATSEASGGEVEELCKQLVEFAPPVLTRVIQIEVTRASSSAADKPTTPSADSAAAANAGPSSPGEQEAAGQPAV
ncbi:hypothetical protein Efla_000929 [Eimeria flavescens]